MTKNAGTDGGPSQFHIGPIGAGAIVLQGQHLTNITLQVADIAEAKALLENVAVASHPRFRGPLLRRLDPLVLVNRVEPLKRVAAFFADPLASLLYVHGMAGIGKSTLVRGAIALRQADILTIWLTCAGLNAEQLLSELVSGLGLYTRLLIRNNAPYIRRLVDALTEAQPAILVLDGFEALLDDRGRIMPDEMRGAIDEITTREHKLRVLVTTRQIPVGTLDGVGGVRTLRLGGLSPDMASDLLRARVPEATRSAPIPANLVEKFGGHPKFIELFAAAVAELPLEQLTKGILTASDIGSYILEQIFTRITDQEMTVLRRAAVFLDTFPFEALQETQEKTPADIRPIVRTLVGRAVLDITDTANIAYYLHPILRDAVPYAIGQEAAAHRAAGSWYKRETVDLNDFSRIQNTLFHLGRAAKLGSEDDRDERELFLLDLQTALNKQQYLLREMSNEAKNRSDLAMKPLRAIR